MNTSITVCRLILKKRLSHCVGFQSWEWWFHPNYTQSLKIFKNFPKNCLLCNSLIILFLSFKKRTWKKQWARQNPLESIHEQRHPGFWQPLCHREAESSLEQGWSQPCFEQSLGQARVPVVKGIMHVRGRRERCNLQPCHGIWTFVPPLSLHCCRWTMIRTW